MSLTWHLVRKDLREFRWPIVGWAALIAAKLLLGLAILSAGIADPRVLQVLGILAQACAALEFAGFLLVILVIQTDGPTDSNAFWLGRPISGGRLLRAKFVTLALVFLLLPVLLTLPWWLWCGMGGAQIAWAALATLLPHLLMVLFGLGAGVLTRSLFQGLAALVGAALLLAIFGGFLEYFVVRGPEIWSRLALGIALGSFGTGLICWLQFTSRQTGRSLVCVGATLGLCASIAHWGPRSGQAESAFYWAIRSTGPVQDSEPAGLSHTVTEASVSRRKLYNGNRTINVAIAVGGVPAREGLEPRRTVFTWRLPDGTTGRATGHASTDFSRRRGWSRYDQTPGGETKDRLFARADVPSAVADRLLEPGAKCEFHLELALVRFDSTTIETGTNSSLSEAGVGQRLLWRQRSANEAQTLVEILHAPVSSLVEGFVDSRRPLPRERFEVRYGVPIHSRGGRMRSETEWFAVVGSVLIAWTHHELPNRGMRASFNDSLYQITWTVRAEFSRLQALPQLVDNDSERTQADD